jgi:hypothetical protein
VPLRLSQRIPLRRGIQILSALRYLAFPALPLASYFALHGGIALVLVALVCLALHTRAYEAWCSAAFGNLLHHTPAEVLGRDPMRNDGLRRTWYWACKEESIDPRKPGRLPLLALDKKFAVAGGYRYVPDCSDINRQAGSDAYCGTSFSDGGSSGGAAGDADGFGGCGGD